MLKYSGVPTELLVQVAVYIYIVCDITNITEILFNVTLLKATNSYSNDGELFGQPLYRIDNLDINRLGIFRERKMAPVNKMNSLSH